ncbi:MAG TPA: DsrE family protein [Saprospiraceae bacterium]|nr:DsrE family protein [Saprospiraceae bacterium]
MKVLFIINEAPYGNEKMYNALPLAHQLKKNDPAADVRIFLMADAVTGALSGQETPNGYYNISRMLKLVLNNGGAVKLCGSCAQARGLTNLSLLEEVEMSNMPELATWTLESDRILVF